MLKPYETFSLMMLEYHCETLLFICRSSSCRLWYAFAAKAGLCGCNSFNNPNNLFSQHDWNDKPDLYYQGLSHIIRREGWNEEWGEGGGLDLALAPILGEHTHRPILGDHTK